MIVLDGFKYHPALILRVEFDSILIRYGEIGLKGGNRGFFEKRLENNIIWALRQEGVSHSGVKRIQGRFIVLCCDAKAIGALSKVFGIVSYSPAKRIGSGVESMGDAAADAVSSAHPGSFRITAQRLDKRMETTSQKINETVGAAVVAKTGTAVSLKAPELTVGLDVAGEHAYLYTETFDGLGGLPVGVSARVICLLSGGIDSPAAAWLMMKRGCPVTLLHFRHEEVHR